MLRSSATEENDPNIDHLAENNSSDDYDIREGSPIRVPVTADTVISPKLRSSSSVSDFVEVTLDVRDDSVVIASGPKPQSPILSMAERLRIMEENKPRPILQRKDTQERVNLRRHRLKRQDSRTAEAKKRRKAKEIYREVLHNTRDTITLVAILIATFAYSVGVSPPGGVHQEGPLIGTAVAARKTAFRVFSVCNNLALFTSLCAVLVLVSIIPFKRKALMRMLAIAHKAIWVAVSFMATAYVSAAVLVVKPAPGRKGMDWTSVFLLSICCGSLGSVFVGVGIMLVKHRVMKRKWRKKKAWERRREVTVDSPSESDGSSTISDMAISRELGYHSY